MRRGFTLIELLVALGVMTLVGTAVYSSYRGAFEAWKKIEARSALYQDIRISLSIMMREIRAAYVSCLDITQPSDASFSQFGFTGKDGKIDGVDSDTLIFVSSAKVPDSDSEIKSYDLSLITYSINPSRKGTGREGVRSGEIAPTISALNFRYYDDKKNMWFNNWEFNKGIPKAVEITITASDPEGYAGKVSISTVVNVESYRR